MKLISACVYLLLINSIATHGQWQTIETKNEPTKRHECSVLGLDGKIFLVGGRGIKNVFAYDPKAKSWSSFQEPPIEMHHIQPVVYHNKIYIVGGLTGKYPVEPPLEHVYIFDPAANMWEQSFPIPESRRRGGAGVAIYDNKIYIANGITLGHTSGTNRMFDVFDPVKGTWDSLANAPHIKDHCSATILNDKLYVVGGRNSSYHEPDNFTSFFSATEGAVDYYDFKMNKWNSLPDGLPVPTAGGGLVAYKDLIIYDGGESKNDLAHSETQCYNTKTKKWTALGSLKTGRHGTGAVILDDKIYTAAGCSTRGGSNELTSIEFFDLLQLK